MDTQKDLIKKYKQNKYRIKENVNINSLKNYVVFDIETTGLDEKRNEIIEIGAVKVTNGIIKTFQSLIRPSKNITKRISDINGITNEMVIDEPPLEVILPDFLDFIEDFPLVAHNASFDVKFILEAIEKYGLDEMENDVVDTLILSRSMLPYLHNHKLVTLISHYNINYDSEHRAMSDAKATYELFKKLKSL